MNKLFFILLLSVTLYLGFIIIIIIIIIMSPISMPLIHNQTCHMPCVQHCCAEPSLCSQLWFKKTIPFTIVKAKIEADTKL